MPDNFLIYQKQIFITEIPVKNSRKWDSDVEDLMNELKEVDKIKRKTTPKKRTSAPSTPIEKLSVPQHRNRDANEEIEDEDEDMPQAGIYERFI